jgi:hypothetical protein
MTDEKAFLIWSIEHDAWWAPHRIGYTRELAEAGHYSEQEAREIVSRANIVAFHECAIPVACLEGAEPLTPPRGADYLGAR